jgi:hypothetical protein
MVPGAARTSWSGARSATQLSHGISFQERLESVDRFLTTIHADDRERFIGEVKGRARRLGRALERVSRRLARRGGHWISVLGKVVLDEARPPSYSASPST